jgi:hypothetical protein
MTPFAVTVYSVTLNAAGMVPMPNNRFPQPRYRKYFQQERIHQIMLHKRPLP